MENSLLAIYMNDQLAAGVVWRELARRSARNNQNTESGRTIATVADEIAEDVQTFAGIMDRLGYRKNRAKLRLAVLAERVGRLKLNGRLTSYSPLSRFTELDTLVMGIEGKKILWENLRDSAELGDRLEGIDFDGLIERAGRQRERLEPIRREAGREALA